MPKRSYEQKLEKYNIKIRKLEEKERKRRKRTIMDSSDSSSDEHAENEPFNVINDAEDNAAGVCEALEKSQERISSESIPVPEIDPEILIALGEVTKDTPKYGDKINENLARLWLPILRRGLDKEVKNKLMKEYLIPENCALLLAPKLNPEMAATVTDVVKSKDKRVEAAQQQLGLGITALNRGMSLLIENDTERIKAIKFISDGCRLLCDLHYDNTDIRKKFVTPALDKAFVSQIQDLNRDDTLFGQKLCEKIKASKAIEKQSLIIKKPAPAKVPAAPVQPSTSRPRVGNWSGPPRYTSNRGGRGAYRKTAQAGRKASQAATKAPAQTPNQAKPRAPPAHQ